MVSGAASGGAELVVKAAITSPAQLRGQTLATPQLGNTQDVALRYWLKGQGFKTDTLGGGDVHVQPQTANSTAVLVACSSRARSKAGGNRSPTPARWWRPVGTCS